MKRRWFSLISFIMILFVFFDSSFYNIGYAFTEPGNPVVRSAAPTVTDNTYNEETVTQSAYLNNKKRYIVKFKNENEFSKSNKKIDSELDKTKVGKKINSFSHFSQIVMEYSNSEVAQLRKDPSIEYIELDQTVSILTAAPSVTEATYSYMNHAAMETWAFRAVKGNLLESKDIRGKI